MPEEINENCTDFADGVARGSNAWNCTSMHSFGNQNTNAVRNAECMGDAEMKLNHWLLRYFQQVKWIFSVLTQAHLRDTGISNYHEVKL
jgi:hypothetical protein